jgi:intergrase/recombinase
MQQSVSIQLKVAHGVRIKEVLKMLRQQGQQLTKHSSDREKQLVFNSLYW